MVNLSHSSICNLIVHSVSSVPSVSSVYMKCKKVYLLHNAISSTIPTPYRDWFACCVHKVLNVQQIRNCAYFAESSGFVVSIMPGA